RAGDRAQRRLVEDDLAPGDRPGDGVGVGDVALDDLDAGREVVQPAGGEVVEHHDVVAPGQEGVDEVRADEAGAAGDERPHDRTPAVAPTAARTASARSWSRASSSTTRSTAAGGMSRHSGRLTTRSDTQSVTGSGGVPRSA